MLILFITGLKVKGGVGCNPSKQGCGYDGILGGIHAAKESGAETTSGCGGMHVCFNQQDGPTLQDSVRSGQVADMMYVF